MAKSSATPPEPDFRALFEKGPGSYLVLAPDQPIFTILAASDAHLRSTMKKREDVLGRGVFEVYPQNPDDPTAKSASDLLASLRKVVETKEPDAMSVLKYDIRRPEAEGGQFEERFWTPVNSPFLNSKGELQFVVNRVEDVTEFVRLKTERVKQLEATESLRTRAEHMEAEMFLRAEQLAEANRRLQIANGELAALNTKAAELDQLKTQFFANVSHELRTPLNLILNPTEALLGAQNLTEANRNDLKLILRNARTLLGRVNDLLDVAKLSARKMAPKYSEVEVVSLARGVAAQFETLAEERDIRYTIDTLPALRAQLDPDQVQRILLNLISNAFKFTPSGGQIDFGLRCVDEQVILEIADSGPGVPEDEREMIFEPFQQANRLSIRGFGGTGLGLAIVRDMVEIHHGKVAVGDSNHRGALFTVKLPLAAPKGTKLVSREEIAESIETSHAIEELRLFGSEVPIEPPAPTLNAPLVLIVEDDPDLCMFISAILKVSYRIAFAGNGEQGLQMARELMPDLILSDVMMPKMTGDAMVRAIRADKVLQPIPIVMLTARSDEDFKVGLLKGGVQDFIAKPFSGPELLARVGRIANEYRKSREQMHLKAVELEGLNVKLRRAMTETHHRVKNNLQVISAFIENLTSQNEELVPTEWLRQVNQHIFALSAVHDILTQQTKSDFEAEYLSVETTVRKVSALLEGMLQGRQIHLNLQEVNLPIQQGTCLAIVLNEILRNAQKHGLGDIHVTFQVLEDTAELSVRDFGKGFPEDFAIGEGGLRGLELVDSMVRWDLQGQPEYRNHPEGGAIVAVRFPIAQTATGEA